MTTQQDARAELIRWLELEAIPHRPGSYSRQMLLKAVALLQADAEVGGEAVAWKPVVGYEGLYEVSSLGQLKNSVTGALRSTNSLAGAGYVKADLWKEGIRKQTTMHRIVAEAFIGPLDGMEVNHKNGIKTDNRADNLEIVTKSENERHSRYSLGNLCKPVFGISSSGRRFYPSIEEAARKTGASAAGIYRCLNGQATDSGGLKWEYATDPDTRPQQAAQVPLTEEQKTAIVQNVVSSSERPIGMVAYGLLVARAIEAAHGITGKEQG